MAKLTITYETIAAELGTARSKLQSFVKRTQLKDSTRFQPDGQVLSGKALTHAFSRKSANTIKAAWNSEGPGRKK